MNLTNNEHIPLPIAVLLATDNYAHNNNPKSISTTTLLKSTRQVVLGLRAKESASKGTADISEKVDSCLGTALHDALEHAWRTNYKKALSELGHPKRMIEEINIDPKEPTDGIDIVLERRTEKEIEGYIITGAFDMSIDGVVHDLKTTKVYSYIKKTNDLNYQRQMSIYKWLNPEVITADHGIILYWFKDFDATKIKTEGYPPKRLMEYKVKLMSYEETEAFIKERLRNVINYIDTPSNDLPFCSDEELWINPNGTVWKYYKDPAKTSRATKNFSSYIEASQRYIEDGSRGLIKEFKPKAKRCSYCDVRGSCNQYLLLSEEGGV